MATSSQSIRKYQQWLNQRRALGHSPPSQDDMAAYLQGDIQARYALADKARDRELEKERMDMLKDYQDKQLALEQDKANKLEDYNKFTGGMELFKLGLSSWPTIKDMGGAAYDWLSRDGGGSSSYELGDFTSPTSYGDTFTGGSSGYDIGDFGMGGDYFSDDLGLGLDFNIDWLWE